jgi:DNA-binding transcriptional LysR family regulator
MKIEEALGTLETDRHGQLKIGTTESYSKGLMPRLLSGFQTSFPFIKIALAVGNSEEIEKSLLYYKNDLALIGITKPSSRFESVPFLREDLVLIVSPNHPLAHQQKVSLKELERFPLIIQAKGSTTRKILIQAFKERNVHPSLLIEAASSEFIKKWVAEGKGVSVIVKRIVEEEERMGLLQTIPLVEKLHFEVACLYLKEERSNPSIKTFINFIGKKGKEEIR